MKKRFIELGMMASLAVGIMYVASTWCSSNSNEEAKEVNLKEEIKCALIDATHRYISKQSPSADSTVHLALVEMALKHDIDLCFMMAQTEIETNYGATGIGKSRKSLFGVMSHTNEDYFQGTEKWCNLVKNKYMGDSKTERDLMRHYVNLSGRRYSESDTYEIALSRAYKKIKSKTHIGLLQDLTRGL